MRSPTGQGELSLTARTGRHEGRMEATDTAERFKESIVTGEATRHAARSATRGGKGHITMGRYPLESVHERRAARWPTARGGEGPTA